MVSDDHSESGLVDVVEQSTITICFELLGQGWKPMSWVNNSRNVQWRVDGCLEFLESLQSIPMNLSYWQRVTAHSQGIAVKPNTPRNESHDFSNIVTVK